MKALIVEDEAFSADRLLRLIHKIDPEIEVLDILTSVKASIEWLNNHEHPDLIFLDIYLEDRSSFDLFEEIEIESPIIFTTAFDQHAIDAFKQKSIDYLLKPIDPVELEAAIDKFKKWNGKDLVQSEPTLEEEDIIEKERFLVKTGSHFQSLLPKDIAYFKAEHKLVFLVTNEGKQYVMDYTMDQLSKMVNYKMFFRISRNRLVNFGAIKSIVNHINNRLKIELNPSEDEEIFVSRDRVAGFKQWLDQ